MLTPTFHFAMLNGYVEVMSRESKIFTEILQTYVDSKKEFDVFPYVKRCALDIICGKLFALLKIHIELYRYRHGFPAELSGK